jgi:MFS family permease
VRERRPAARALAVIGAHRVGYGLMTISLMLLCRNYFTDAVDVDGGLALLGQAVVATGTGIGAAAFLTPIAVTRLGPQRWIGGCVAAAGLVQLALVLAFTWPVALAGAFALGLTGQAAKICVDSVVQESVDDAFRGRVFAFYDVIFNSAFLTAAGIAVLALPLDGHAPALYAGIAVVDVLAAAAYLLAGRRRPEQAITRHDPALLSR